MHDIKAIRADGPAFDAALARRGVAAASERFLIIDTNSRELTLWAVQRLLARRRIISKLKSGSLRLRL